MKRAPRLPRDLLDRAAGEAARLVALDELERARRARESLGRGDDPEALHDFRVGLRRLRCHLRAFRAELDDAVGRKLRRRLRALAARTNPGRDAEVGLELLAALAADAEPPERRAASALGERLGKRRDEAYREATGELATEFDQLAERLHDRLAVWQIEVRLDGDEPAQRSFRAALGEQLAGHADALLGALEQVAATSDPAAAHRARIEAKRLRYLLEPVSPMLEAARAPAAKLRDLQDLLGGMNDLAVLAGELAAEAAEAERALLSSTAAGRGRSRRAGGRTGRAALARRIAERRREQWTEFAARWLGPDAAEAGALAADLSALVDALA